MASRRRKILSKKAQLARERKRSKKLGYSLTFARQKRERAASKAALETAKRLKELVPALKPLARKSRLTPAEKAKITHYAKELRGVTDLVPVSKKVAKENPSYLFKPGVQAIRFANISSTAKVEPQGDGFFIETNGRTWLYWPLPKATVRNKKGQLKDVAAKAFQAQFPIELAAALAEKAFKTLNVEVISLWTHAGRNDATFKTLNQFIFWMNQKWQAGRYVTTREGGYEQESDPGAWINGIAVAITNPKAAKSKKPANAKSKKAKSSRKKNSRR